MYNNNCFYGVDMKYLTITYGCQMNLHESEKAAGILEGMGYTPTDAAEDADLIIFNTCCIRDTAEKRAFGNIGALKPLKKQKKDLIIAVMGCMTEQKGYDEIFRKKYPYVDIVLGTNNLDKLESFIRIRREKGRKSYENVSCDNPINDDLPVTRTSYPNAWVNIMYGCNNFCSYCIVPYVRGRERSRNPEDIVSEVRALVESGYKEITLLGQNVNSYGHDLKDKSVDFAYILEEIAGIEGKFRIRFMTSHPKDLNAEVVDVIAKYPNICNNIHLPVQAGSNDVLRKMNRRYTRERYFSLIDMIRSKIPDCGITTDIMVGFPEETEEDFSQTLSLVEKVRFSNAFTFVYSMRKGTKAVEMQQVDFKTKQRRIKELIALQNRITKEISLTYIGGVYEILVEDVSAKHDGCVCGRTDSGRLVTFKGGADLIGQFVKVKITQSRSASLFGELTEQG